MRPFLRQDIFELLNDVEDASRVVQKFLLGRGDVGDLSSICLTIRIWSSIQKRLEEEKDIERAKGPGGLLTNWACVDALLESMSDLGLLASRIASALACQQSEDGVESSFKDADEDIDQPSDAVFSFDPTSWKIKPK